MRVFVILLCLLFIATPVMGFNRSVVMEVDGYIDMHSITENCNSKAGVSVQGSGHVKYSATSKVGENLLEQSYRIDMVSGDTLHPLKAVSAMQASEDDTTYNYALLVQPGKLQAGWLYVNYCYGELAQSITAEASVTGDFKNHIYLYNPKSGYTLKEWIEVTGWMYYLDTLNIFEQTVEAE